MLKAPLSLPSSLVLTLESSWTQSQRSASSPLCPSVRPSPMSATCVKTTSPSAHPALFNDAPPREPSSTKHDRQRECGSLLSLTV